MAFHSPTRKSIRIRSGLVLGAIMLIALLAFEAFNYSTTQYALADLLGPLTFAGIPWATILSIAFCGIDFAGIARLFTPDQAQNDPNETWYLFGAWLLAATMNAILTWWGVSMAIANHALQSASIVPAATISHIVPVFVAVMVWFIRILIIGTISVSVDRFVNHEGRFLPAQNRFQSLQPRQVAPQPTPLAPRPSILGVRNQNPRSNDADDESPMRIEPTYHSIAVTARPQAGANKSVSEPEVRRSKLS
jgi:hypothetical protein